MDPDVDFPRVNRRNRRCRIRVARQQDAIQKAFHDDPYSFHYHFLSLLGLWTYDFKLKILQKLFYLHRCVTVNQSIWILSLGFIELYLSRSDFRKISYNLSTTLFAVAIMVKNLLLAYESQKINNIRMRLFRDAYPQNEPYQIEAKKHFRRIFDMMKKCFYYSVAFCFPVWIGSSLYTFKSGPRELPFSIWIPVNVNNDYEFIFAFTFHFLIGGYIMLEAVHGELASYTLIVQLAAQYEILSHDFAQIRLFYEAPACGSQNRDSNRALIDREARKRLIKCVRRHVQLNKYAKTMESSHSKSIFFGILIGLALMVVNGVEILQQIMWGSTLKGYYQSGYAFIITTDVFLACSMGSMLMTEKKKLADTIYYLPWHELDLVTRRDFVLIVLNAQQDQPLLACKLIRFEITTFLSIVKTVSSWLALCWQFMK